MRSLQRETFICTLFADEMNGKQGFIAFRQGIFHGPLIFCIFTEFCQGLHMILT